MDHDHGQKQKQFTSKSSLALAAVLAIFTGVMLQAYEGNKGRKRQRNVAANIIAISILVSTLFFATLSTAVLTYADHTPCKCVIFELDDVTDSGFTNVQVAVMNEFIARNKPLQVYPIVEKFGNLGPDHMVLSKVREGYEKGLFYVGIHGWQHVKYSELSEATQREHFTKAQDKLQSLSFPKSKVFDAPHTTFNQYTIKVMAELGMDTISASVYQERLTYNPYKVSTSYHTDNSIVHLSEVPVTDPPTKVYHTPYRVSIQELLKQGYQGDALVQEALKQIDSNIADYGHVVIVQHPTDFVQKDISGKNINQVDPNKFKMLTDIMDGVDAKDYSTVQLSKVVLEEGSPPRQVTSLTLNTITNVPWGKDVTVTGKLAVGSSNAGVGGKTITFDRTGADNLPDNVVTNQDGTFTAVGKAPNTVATGWKVQAHFAGDSTYSASDSTIKTYNTAKHAVSLVVSAATTVPWGKPTTFTATLKDTSLGGVPISGKSIHFDGTGVIEVADKTTDSSGKAIGTGTAPDTVNTGWTYQAHFAGDSLYLNKDGTVKTYSTTKHATSLTIALSPSTVASDKTYRVYGVLKDISTGAVLSSKTITFTADSSITIAEKTTDSAGKYDSGSLPAPDDAGTYDIQSHFAGDSLYSAKDSAIKTLTVTAAAATAAASTSPSDADTEEESTTTSSPESSSSESTESTE
jgi:peptidoglycan/xylan/chitin deacetylase (PgdA/CDA1 family)